MIDTISNSHLFHRDATDQLQDDNNFNYNDKYKYNNNIHINLYQYQYHNTFN